MDPSDQLPAREHEKNKYIELIIGMSCMCVHICLPPVLSNPPTQTVCSHFSSAVHSGWWDVAKHGET